MALQWILPAQVLTDSKGTVGAMVGLITLLLALVLGLLVFTAFSVFTTQQAEAQSLGPVVIELDLILEQYGPEAIRGRLGLREALGRSRKRFFGDAKRGPIAHTFEETRATLHWMNTYFDSLQPSTERQRKLVSSAQDLAKDFAQTQMLMTRQLSNPFPPFVLVVVVFWAAALFFGNGLVATPNLLSVGAHLVGAVAIATAIFLILELSQPYSGMVRLSPAGVDRLLQVLGSADTKEAARAPEAGAEGGDGDGTGSAESGQAKPTPWTIGVSQDGRTEAQDAR
jgi:hypothetical protein